MLTKISDTAKYQTTMASETSWTLSCLTKLFSWHRINLGFLEPPMKPVSFFFGDGNRKEEILSAGGSQNRSDIISVLKVKPGFSLELFL